MGIVFGFGVNAIVYVILGLLLSDSNPWLGMFILVLAILATAFSGYITAYKSKKSKIFNVLFVSIFSYMVINSTYNSGDIDPSYLNYAYLVQLVPASLLGAIHYNILQKKKKI